MLSISGLSHTYPNGVRALAPINHFFSIQSARYAVLRELENVIHCALIVCRDGNVRATDFRFSPLARTSASAARPATDAAPRVDAAGGDAHGSPAMASRDDGIAALEQALDRAMDAAMPRLFDTFEAVLVRRAFARSHENQVQSARLLGITRNTLRTLLKRHGLLGPPMHPDLATVDEPMTRPSAPVSAPAPAPAYSD